MQQVKPVLLTYTKEFNKSKHAKRPRTTATGNVILLVEEDTISKFDIPTVDIPLPIVVVDKDYSYQNIYGKTIVVNNRVKAIKQMERGKLVTLILEKKCYPINFPYFFNTSMISQAVAEILKGFSQREKVTFMINNSSKKYYWGKEVTDWGVVKLGTLPLNSRNTEKTPTGATVVVKPSTRTIKNILNNI